MTAIIGIVDKIELITTNMEYFVTAFCFVLSHLVTVMSVAESGHRKVFTFKKGNDFLYSCFIWIFLLCFKLCSLLYVIQRIQTVKTVGLLCGTPEHQYDSHSFSLFLG
jgi:hypothetical protein